MEGEKKVKKLVKSKVPKVVNPLEAQPEKVLEKPVLAEPEPSIDIQSEPLLVEREYFVIETESGSVPLRSIQPVIVEPEPVEEFNETPSVVREPPSVVPETPTIEPETPSVVRETPPIVHETPSIVQENGIINDEPLTFQKLEEKAAKAQEALEKEEKLRKDLESLNSKLLAEKTALLDSLSGEKGALQDYQEKCAKLTAQKNDLDNQLRVSIQFNLPSNFRDVKLNTSQIQRLKIPTFETRDY